MPVRSRANIVCTECHSRKIKCDLQSISDGPCKNCRRSHQKCIQRDGVRKRRPERLLHDSARQESQIQKPPSARLPSQELDTTPASLPQQCNSFVSYCSAIPNGDSPEKPRSNTDIPEFSLLRNTLLESIKASAFPKPGLFTAWADAYMTHAFHHCPVVERKDLSGSYQSSILQYGVCLVGNLMRHDSKGPKLAGEFHEKIKILLSINYSQDQVEILKTLCLLTCWDGISADQNSVDGPWHWIGVALRLILRLGLHRESTYAGRDDAGCLRRIFWQLQNSDSLQVVSWGRPPLLQRKDFDVKPPSLEDFESPNIQSFVFLETTKLCTIISSISDLHSERRPVHPEQLASIETALRDWVGHLPAELQLYDKANQRNKYCHQVSEIFIQYFVAIILNDMLKDRDGGRHWRVSVSCIIAASCAVALYDEIHCRDDTIFLPSVHGFFCLAVSLPLLHFAPQSQAKDSARTRDLGVLRSILIGMRDRYGESDAILGKMENLQRSLETRKTRIQDGNNTLLEPQEPHPCPSQLFPFPSTFCDNMDMLGPATTPIYQFVADNIESALYWPAHEGTFDFTLMDLFDLDLGNSSILFESETGGLGEAMTR